MLPEELDAMVMYYGEVVTDPQLLDPVDVPILGLFGAADELVPLASVQAFRAALSAAGKDAYVHIYSDARHAFANPSGGNFNAAVAEDAWNRTIEFLARHLHPAAPEAEQGAPTSIAR
jgi:carboxymethylenebutenolidase